MKLRGGSLVGAMIYIVALVMVGMLHFGCEEEPTAPPNCGQGPFVWESKSGVCKSQATGAVVDDKCCP